MKKQHIPRAGFWMFLICATAFLQLTLATSAQGATRNARVMAARVNGAAEYRTTAKDPWQALRVGMVLSEGAQIRTGAGTLLDVALSTGAIVRLNDNTEISIGKLAIENHELPTDSKAVITRSQIVLVRGHIVCEAGKQAPSSTFEVKTPIGTFDGYGAEFMIWFEGNHVLIRSFQGAVLLQSGKNKTVIFAGQQMSAAFNPANGQIFDAKDPATAPQDDTKASQYAAFKSETAALAGKVIDKGAIDFSQLLQTLKTSGQALPGAGVVVIGNPSTTSEVSPSSP